MNAFKLADIKLSPFSDVILKQWCDNNLPEIHAMDKYSPSWEVFKEQRAQGIVKVFAHGAKTENMIFNYNRTRLYYRAWHDSLHLAYNLPFGGENELKLAGIQRYEAQKLGINPFDALLLELDLFCHINYYDTHKEHPEQQRALILDYLSNGESAFINVDYAR